jgi:hypothetical protein
MTPKETFNRFGALPIKNVVSKDVAVFLTQAMMRASYYEMGKIDDDQVPGALACVDHEYMFETLQESIWHSLENVIEEELIPTYSYARIYTNGNVLERHTDRPSCEISVTVQLARTHHYAWPIYMGGQRFDLAECDGVIYKGCEIEHWRDACAGPDGYMSGQVFMHFVRKNGPHAQSCIGDGRWGGAIPFSRESKTVWEMK